MAEKEKEKTKPQKKTEDKKEYLKKSEEEEFFEFLDRQVRDHPVVKVHHGKWKELIEWADKGEQYSEWDGDKVISIHHKLKKRKKLVVINLMKPLGEALLSKIELAHQLAGSPSSSDLNDTEASKVATKFLAHNDYINHIQELDEDFKYDLVSTGNAWYKWTWDRNGHGYIGKKEEDGSYKPVKEEGEVRAFVPSVFNIRPDPTAKKREDMRWLIELAEVPEDEILRKFKITEEELKMKMAEEPEGTKYEGMNEPEEEKDKEEKTHIVKYYWEKKSDKYPDGRYIIALDNLILYKGKNPALGEIPYFHVGFKRCGNSLWHTSPYHHVQPIQREFNRTISIISEHHEGWRAKMIVPKGSIMKEGAFTTDSFELLEVDTTKGDPRPANMPELSPQVTAWRDFLMGAVDKVSNVHEVSYAQLPQYASRAPASLYSMMLEQENMKIDPMIKRLNKNLVEMGKFRLRLMDKYYTQPRMVKIVGKAQESTVEYFRGSDLKGNFDVKLEIGVSLNQPKIIKQRLLMELKQVGAPIDWNKIFKLLSDEDISEHLRGDLADESRAIRENQAFIHDTHHKDRKEGGVFIMIDDDHDVHLEHHTNLIKTEEAQGWEDAKFNSLMQHIEEHRQFLMAAQQMAMGAGEGAPAGPGGVDTGMPSPGGGMDEGGGGRPGPVPEEGAPPEEGGAGASPEVDMLRNLLTSR